ncbi:hypothetical protein [Piscirickettsia litoralis]|nr:hypothetical protein [Piscirickettsia litoralis]
MALDTVITPLKPILTAVGQSAVDAIINANPNLSEEELRDKLKESKIGGKRYPVIRIKLTAKSGVRFWKFYEKFF